MEREISAMMYIGGSDGKGVDELIHSDQWVRARRRPREMNVVFSTTRTVVQTLEGPVVAEAGDAIITGAHGECWPVAQARFPSLYAPAPGTAPGQDGLYVRTGNEVRAARMTEPFLVELSDGRGQLKGQAGDWLIDHGGGNFGAVAAKVFVETYEVIS